MTLPLSKGDLFKDMYFGYKIKINNINDFKDFPDSLMDGMASKNISSCT